MSSSEIGTNLGEIRREKIVTLGQVSMKLGQLLVKLGQVSVKLGQI
jgi:hypothetical protein